MDILKNKQFVSIAIIAVVIIAIVVIWKHFQEKNAKSAEGYVNADSINNQLNPNVKETQKDFDYLYDKKTGLLMYGSDFGKDDFEGKFGQLEKEDIPIPVIAPDSFLLDDGNNGRTGLHTAMCSKQCCSSQYPLPFKMDQDKKLCNLKNFVPNNLMCNNAWNDSGCLCLTADNANFLTNRGGNA